MIDSATSANARPVGYLFSDIERSTERWERSPQHMRAAVKRHNALIDELVAKHGGVIRDRAGDGVFAVFDAGNPLRCALDIQLALQRHDWSAVGGLEVRIGIHVSELREGAEIDQPSVNRAARIVASGWGGQIVVSGQAMSAYAAPEGARFVDLGMCHFEGIDEPLKLCGLVHSDLDRREFPPLRSHLVQVAEIPQATGFFVGRETDLSELAALMQRERIVTIVGPGGGGKTRLAAKIAADCADRRAVVFVSLEQVLTEPDLVAAIAGALRFPFHGAKEHDAQLIDYLRSRTMLFVLDNCDVLAGRGDFLGELVQVCPNVDVLCTSREPLRVEEEAVYRLAGLECESIDPDRVFQSSAYQLFAFEARAQNAPLKRGADEARTFQAICERVNGSPLALRLIARWSRFVALRDMLAHIESDASFLAEGELGGHNSLRGVFEGSWKLLTDTQRIALTRLSVFAGAFDWNAAKHVGDVDLATYAALADKSLLEEDTQHRFLMHPLVRGYAREKLALTPSEEALSLKRHSDHYLDLVKACGDIVVAGERNAALDRLQAGLADVRAAWTYANATGSDRVRKSLAALHDFCIMRSLIREAIALFSLMPADRSAQAIFDGVLATCLCQSGDLVGAEAAAKRVFSARGEALARAFARQSLGAAAHARGDYANAQRHYVRALRLWDETGARLNAPYAATSLAWLHFTHGNRSESARWIKQAFRLSREAANGLCVLTLQMLAGDLALQEDRPGAAKINYHKAIENEATDTAPHIKASVLRRLGSLSRRMNDVNAALEYHTQALELSIDVGERRAKAHALLEVGEDLVLVGRFGEARQRLLDACRLANELGIGALVVKGAIATAQLELQHGVKRHAARIAGALRHSELHEHGVAYRALVDGLDAGDVAPDMEDVVTVLSEIEDEYEIGWAD